MVFRNLGPGNSLAISEDLESSTDFKSINTFSETNYAYITGDGAMG